MHPKYKNLSSNYCSREEKMTNFRTRQTLESKLTGDSSNNNKSSPDQLLDALNFATGLPLINLRYTNSGRKTKNYNSCNFKKKKNSNDKNEDFSDQQKQGSIVGFSSLDALRKLTSQYVVLYPVVDYLHPMVVPYSSLYYQSNYYDQSRNLRPTPGKSDDDTEDDGSGGDTANDKKRSSRLLNCYISLKKSTSRSSCSSCHRSSGSERETCKCESIQTDSLPIPPLITVLIPPNCRLVKEKDSLQMCASCTSSDDCSLISDLTSCRDGFRPSRSAGETVSSSGDGMTSGESDDEVFSDSEEGSSFIDIVSVPPPPERQWLVNRTFNNESNFGTFSVMSYNILCDKYATSNMYAYCPSWALTWDYRKKYVLSEITKHDSDIVALQEVETDQYHKFFKPELASRGYSGTFSPKSRAKTMIEEERKFVDGCAIFWKNDKFVLDSENVIEFTQLAIANADGNEQMLNRVMTRDNIALVAVFKIRKNVYQNGSVPVLSESSIVDTPLVVCTAHIHWDPEFCDVKLIQSMMLVQELTAVVDKTAFKWGTDSSCVPVVACGDLNSLPDSGVYEYLTTGKINVDHVDFKDFRGQTCVQKLSTLPMTQDLCSHKLKFKSAYDPTILPFTNYTYDFKGVIDYVFGTSNLFRLGVLGPMDSSWFQENKIVGCPFPGIPSDHIPLVVNYAIVPPNQNNLIRSRAIAPSSSRPKQSYM